MGWIDRLFSHDPTGSGKVKPQTGEAGSDGDSYVAQVDAGGPDINPELAGQSKFVVYHEMVTTDPQVLAAYLMYVLPIRAAQWDFEPASEEAEDKVIEEACRVQFGLHDHFEGWLDLSWSESIGSAAQYLKWGSFFEEMVWGDPLQWEPEDGEARTIRPLLRLAPRYPSTIREIEVAKDGTIAQIIQDLPDTSPIPGDKIVPYVHDREGAHWYGKSMLRAMYGPWRLKKAMMIGAAIGWDRYAAGVPVVRYPAGDQAAERKAQEIGRSYRVHERAWITLPGQPPPTGDWSVEILNGSSTLADPTNLLRHYDEQIALGALQMAFKLGSTETGSRAVGEVLADPYYLAVQAVAAYIARQRQKYAVRRFVDVNFGQEYEVPRLVVSKIEAKNVEQLVGAIGSLSGAGHNLTDRETQNFAREQVGLPDLPDDAPEQPPVPGQDQEGAELYPEGEEPEGETY